jgi:hypothetical protein
MIRHVYIRFCPITVVQNPPYLLRDISFSLGVGADDPLYDLFRSAEIAEQTYAGFSNTLKKLSPLPTTLHAYLAI